MFDEIFSSNDQKHGIFDDVIDIFSLRNLFTPLFSFFQDMRGPHTYFGVASMGNHSKRQVRQILERKHIQVWGDIYDGGIFYFNVPQKKEREAYRVLIDNQVVVIFPKFEV